MKTHTQFLAILTALIAAGLTAQAQYTYTTLDDPGTNSSGPDTLLASASGTNIVGGYGSWFGGGVIHGLVLRGTNWSTLDDPSAGSDANQGTYAAGISGTNIVGWFIGSGGAYHGFLLSGGGSTASPWTTLDAPGAYLSPSYGTDALGIDGTNVTGFYNDAGAIAHGFLYNIIAKTWIELNDPLAGTATGQGTYVERISGNLIVGAYEDGSSVNHGFVYTMSTSNWTTLDAPLGIDGTVAFNISGSNIVGLYIDAGEVYHGFLYNTETTTWQTLDDPQAGQRANQGTVALGVQGATINGYFIDAEGIYHGFLAAPMPRLNVAQAGATLNVSWPYWNNALTGWTLQQNADVTTTNWTPAPTAGISTDGTNNYYMITPSPVNLFFRLSQQ
jgi:hypothetical protein